MALTEVLRLAALALLACASQGRAEVTQSVCGPIYGGAGSYGPYDYRVDKDKLPIVENAHFTASVEQLIAGKSTDVIGADISYTLRRFPNHHRALVSMMRLGAKVRSDTPAGAGYTVECFFERALRFKKDDIVARMLYATYLVEHARVNDALAQLAVCLNLADDNAISHFNIGLIYFDAKRSDLALAQAHKAMALGLTWPGLKDKLVKAGAWAEPPAANAASAAEVPSATSSAAASAAPSSAASTP